MNDRRSDGEIYPKEIGLRDATWLMTSLAQAYVQGQIAWREEQESKHNHRSMVIDYGTQWRSITCSKHRIRLPLQQHYTIKIPLPLVPPIFHPPIGRVPYLMLDEKHSLSAKANYIWKQSDCHQIADVTQLNAEVGLGVQIVLGVMKDVLKYYERFLEMVDSHNTWGVFRSVAPCYLSIQHGDNRWTHVRSDIKLGKVCLGTSFGCAFHLEGGWFNKEQYRSFSLGGYLCYDLMRDRKINIQPVLNHFTSGMSYQTCRLKSPFFDFIYHWLASGCLTGCIQFKDIGWHDISSSCGHRVYLQGQRLTCQTAAHLTLHQLKCSLDKAIRIQTFQWLQEGAEKRLSILTWLFRWLSPNWWLTCVQLDIARQLKPDAGIHVAVQGYVSWLCFCFSVFLQAQLSDCGTLVLTPGTQVHWAPGGYKLLKIPMTWFFAQRYDMGSWLELAQKKLWHLLPILLDKLIGPLERHVDVSKTDLQLACLLKPSEEDRFFSGYDPHVVLAHLSQQHQRPELNWRVAAPHLGQSHHLGLDLGFGITWSSPSNESGS